MRREIDRMVALCLIVSACASGGCGTSGEKPACRFEQPFPYSSDSPYLGVHGNRENNDRIFCPGPAEGVERSWAALAGRMVVQPVAFSADGNTIYATVMRTEGCRLYAVDRKSGKEIWCSEHFTVGVAGSSVESDEDGYLYLTDGGNASTVYSLHPEDGSVRWRTSLAGLFSGTGSVYHAPLGLHFTPDGYLATVTPDGVVVLLDRSDGRVLTHFDIQSELGFVPPPRAEIPMELVPQYVFDRYRQVIGEMSEDEFAVLINGTLGGSGSFSDNTIAVSALNQLFVVGGGPTTEQGSLVALNVVAGTPDPHLELAWYVTLAPGSATSPALSRDGTRVVVGDGTSGLLYIDVEACNDNTDSDPHAEFCAPLWSYPLLGGKSLGSVSLDENGVVYAWHSSSEAKDPDLFALGNAGGQPELLWQHCFADGDINAQWTSSATVTDNLVIGTVSFLEGAMSGPLSGLPFYENLTHELVAVDRFSGEVVWRTAADDDSVNSPAIGPDGAIYLPIMGTLDLLSTASETHYQGGIVRYVPEMGEDATIDTR